MTPEDVLKIKMYDNDAGAKTVGQYLMLLLEGLWENGEAFSGKRPFGNSGWQYEIYEALVASGAVSGELDEDGLLDSVDNEEAHKVVLSAIKYLFNG
jgi:hypothetical protein